METYSRVYFPEPARAISTLFQLYYSITPFAPWRLCAINKIGIQFAAGDREKIYNGNRIEKDSAALREIKKEYNGNTVEIGKRYIVEIRWK